MASKKSALTDSQKRLLEKAEAAADYPESWIPETSGDHIIGFFAGLTQGPTAFGNAPIVLLNCDGTLRSVWVFHEALKSQFLRARPEIGEEVCIFYKGKRQAKNPTPGRSPEYHDYVVSVDRGEGDAMTWDALDGLSVSAEPSDEEAPY